MQYKMSFRYCLPKATSATRLVITAKCAGEALRQVIGDVFPSSIGKHIPRYVIDDIDCFIASEPLGVVLFRPGATTAYRKYWLLNRISIDTVHMHNAEMCYVAASLYMVRPSATPFGAPIFGRYVQIDPLVATIAVQAANYEQILMDYLTNLNLRFPGISRVCFLSGPVESPFDDRLLEKRLCSQLIADPTKALIYRITPVWDMGHSVIMRSHPHGHMRDDRRFVLGTPDGLYYLKYHRYTPPKTPSSLLRHNGINCTDKMLQQQWDKQLGLQAVLALKRANPENSQEPGDC